METTQKPYILKVTSTDKKNEHAAAWQLLRSMVASHLNIPEESVDLDGNVVKGSFGKPAFSGNLSPICFNLSHSDGVVAAVIAKHPIGVDIQRVCAFPQKVMTRTFREDERQLVYGQADKELYFFKLWAAKESYIKYTGRGLHFPMRDVPLVYKNGVMSLSDYMTQLAISILTPTNDNRRFALAVTYTRA